MGRYGNPYAFLLTQYAQSAVGLESIYLAYTQSQTHKKKGIPDWESLIICL